MAELHTWPARRIAAAVAAREVSAEEVVRHHLERIAAHEHLNAFITVTADLAIARAREQPSGPLAGVPLLVKDVFDTAGVRTTYGSTIFRDNVPVRTATSVRRLDAGAVMVGKANLHEFSVGVTSRNLGFGAVRNSTRPDRIPAAPRAATQPRSPPACARSGSARTPGHRSARRRRRAASPGSSRPTAASRPTACGRWRRRSTTSVRSARTMDDCALAFDVLRASPLPAADASALRVRELRAEDTEPTMAGLLTAAGLPPAPDPHAPPPRGVRRGAPRDRRRAPRGLRSRAPASHRDGPCGLARGARGARRRAARLARGVPLGVSMGHPRLAPVPRRAARARRARRARAHAPHDHLHAPDQLARLAISP